MKRNHNPSAFGTSPLAKGRKKRTPSLLKRGLGELLLGILLTLWPGFASAQIMTSASFRIPFDALGGGGLRSTSSNFVVEDTISEIASPTGENLSSTNFRACVGYQCLEEEAFLTVTYAVQSAPCDGTSASSPPYAIPLGTLTTSAVATGANRFCARVTSNAFGGEVVQVRSDNAALASISTPGDTIPSSSATLVAGTTGYGVCSSNAQNGFTANAPYNGTCNTGAGHTVGAVTTSAQTIWSAPGPVSNAFGEMLVKAAISSSVPAHTDYQDILTITVTGTY